MAVTKSGSGSKKGANFAGMPEAVLEGPEPKVLLKMLVQADGYNPGEVIRVKRSIAGRMVGKKQAMLHGPTISLAGGLTAVAAQKAITLLGRADDAKRLIAVRMKEIWLAIKDAEEAVRLAYEARDSELDNIGGGRAVLEEADEKAKLHEAEVLDQATKAVTDANDNLSKAEKSLKKAKDKEAAEALITEAKKVLVKAEDHRTAITSSAEMSQAARTKEIQNIDKAEASTMGSAETYIAEMETALEVSTALDTELTEMERDGDDPTES